MTRRERLNHWVTVALTIVMLPGRIVEEGIHTLAALPFAERIAVQLDPSRGTAETVVQYRDGTPAWAITAAYLAPEVLAVAAAVAVVGYWLVGGAVWWPASTLDWVLCSVLGAQYLAIALPSAEDADRSAEGTP